MGLKDYPDSTKLRVASDFLIGITGGKLPDILQEQLNEMVKQINREAEATKGMFSNAAPSED